MSTIPQRSKTPRGTAYWEVGQGETLVLIHGVGLRLEAWGPQIDHFRHSHRVIAVDMPGHGETPRLARGSRLQQFVAWLGAFLDEMRIERVNLCGHSMGALIAGGSAVTFGDRIARVALVNGVFRRNPQAHAAVVARAREIEQGNVDLASPLSRWFERRELEGAPYQSTRGWLSQVDVDGYATAYAAFAEGDATYADAWPRIACPSLFLTGGNDPNSTPEMSRAMAASARAGQAVVIDGHRHMVNLTAPDLVNHALAEWLQQ
jgi:pimeloyl-ACP methyl ester carboxylesterase